MRNILGALCLAIIIFGTLLLTDNIRQMKANKKLADEIQAWSEHVSCTGKCWEWPEMKKGEVFNVPSGTWVTAGDSWYCEAIITP